MVQTTTEDGDELTTNQMLEEMGIETTDHPTVGVTHRFENPESGRSRVVEVHGVRHGELNLESKENGTYSKPVTELYRDWEAGDLVIKVVSIQGVANHETVVDRKTLATLADAVNPIGQNESIEERLEAVDNAYDALGSDTEVGRGE